MPVSFRIIVASPREGLTMVEAPPGVEEAYLLMVDDNVPQDDAAVFALGAAKSGRDPVAFARHFVSLRRGLREHKEQQG